MQGFDVLKRAKAYLAKKADQESRVPIRERDESTVTIALLTHEVERMRSLTETIAKSGTVTFKIRVVSDGVRIESEEVA